MTHPQCRKVLLQRHVALESHGLAAQARLASIETSSQDYKFSEEATMYRECVSWRFYCGKTQSGVFLMTHIRSQTHNPSAYCTRVNKI